MSRLSQLLKGVRVIDMSRYLPGPLATLLLSDLGAEVIKIEPPRGDPMREVGPQLPDGRGIWHEAVNAGKSLYYLDLKKAQDRQSLFDLLESADVLVESFRPGVMAELGMDPRELRKKLPRLICVSLSGYGQEGPQRDAAGHDNNYLSQAGFLAGVGPSRELPTLIDPPIADCLGSLFGMSSILAALMARDRDHQGCHIDIALADVVMPLQTFALAGLGTTEAMFKRAEGPLSGGWACYAIYRTADGQEVALGAVEPKFWAAFCTAAGRQDWVVRQSDPLPQQSLKAEVAEFFSGHTGADLEARFAGVDCCLSRVLSLQDAVHSAHHRNRGLVIPSGLGSGYQALYPAKIDGQGPAARTAMAAWSPAGIAPPQKSLP